VLIFQQNSTETTMLVKQTRDPTFPLLDLWTDLQRFG